MPIIIGVLFASTAIAQDSVPVSQRVAIKNGKDLFQKEWTHVPPDMPQQGNLDDARYKNLLTMLPGDGLGPMFNAKSCAACHAGGAGADVDRNVTLVTLDPRSPDLAPITNNRRFDATAIADHTSKLQKSLDDLFPAFISPSGALSFDVVVHESSTRAFYDPMRDQLADGVSGGIDATWFDAGERTSQAIADQPVIAGRRGGLDYYLSQRNSPPLFGLGLIDQITDSRLLNIARVQSSRTRGKVTGRVGTGKFGWRAQTTSLHSFVMGACAGELGLQVPNTPQPPDLADATYVSLGEDLNHQKVNELVAYVASLPAPIQERMLSDDWAGVRQGKRTFAKIGCAVCHVETVAPARGIYSDLLLHDMGDLLQAPSPASSGRLRSLTSMRIPRFARSAGPFGSSRSISGYYGGSTTVQPYAFKRPAEAQFPYGQLPPNAIDVTNPKDITWDVLQREWRTPPLWGVADSAPYLHDGRAKTLDAAIRWHGGEANDSLTQYRSLSKADRELVIRFLKSLRAPATPRVPDVIRDLNDEGQNPQELAANDPMGASPTSVITADSDDPLAIFTQAY